MSERRHHPRVTARSTGEVRCTSRDAEAEGLAPHDLARKLIDVSAKGICIVTSGRLRPGLALSVDLNLPGVAHRKRLRGVVRWSTTVESKGRTAHVAGVEFERADASLVPPEKESRSNTPSTATIRALDPNRRHKRFQPERAEVTLLPRDLLRSLGFKRNSGKRVKDVSLGGAQIVSVRPLKPGAKVDLTIQFLYPQVSVSAAGVVRWCRRDTMSVEKRWFVGVVFKDLDPRSDLALKNAEDVFLSKPP
jgi:hypothetical protein